MQALIHDVKGDSDEFWSMHVSFFNITIDAKSEEETYLLTGAGAGTGPGPHIPSI